MKVIVKWVIVFRFLVKRKKMFKCLIQIRSYSEFFLEAHSHYIRSI